MIFLGFWPFEPHFLINFFLIKKTCSSSMSTTHPAHLYDYDNYADYADYADYDNYADYDDYDQFMLIQLQ